MKFVSSILLFVGVLCWSSLGVTRDGTLPRQLEGYAEDDSLTRLNAVLEFDDSTDIIINPGNLNCSLQGANIKKFSAKGSIRLNNNIHDILGTCKTTSSDRFEIVTKRDGKVVNFLGRVTNSHSENAKFKGIVNIDQKRLKFSLE